MGAGVDVASLRDRAYPLTDDQTRVAVPEPVVKAVLAELGVEVPGEAVDGPAVVKAYGPGIVHKSEVGAVQVGVEPSAVDDVIAAMTVELKGHGLEPDGFLVEALVDGTAELLVGVVRRPPFGAVVAVGLGGTLTEILDDVATRLLPIDERDAHELLDGFKGAAVLRGVRGAPPVDRDALVRLLLGIAGPDGFATRLGADLAELECNPVIAGPGGAVAADARLVLHAATPPTAAPPAPADFDALFAPRSIAIAGVSTKGQGFGTRALAAYRELGWSENLFVLHPSATEIDGFPAFPSLADVPGGGVDYLLVAVPAAACIDLVREQGARARIAHVITGGFGETGPDGSALEASLLDAARTAGVRFVGPNCIGAYAPAGRQTFQLGVPHDAGPVGVVSQSGGLAGDIVKLGAARGLRFSALVSAGNAIDVMPGEIVEHLVADDGTGIIGLYLEGARDGERTVAALRRARGSKPVVALVGGLSGEGSDAVASHTGSLTGDERVWDAVVAATGITVVRTLEDLVGALVFHQRYADHPAPGDPGVMLLGVGGGASVLGADACDRAGLQLTRIGDALAERLRRMGYGAGTSVVNPFEVPMGPAASPDTFNRLLDAVLPEQPFSDVLLHVNVAAYYGYGTGGVAQLLETLELLSAAAPGWPARLTLVTRNVDVAPADAVDALAGAAIATGIPLYRTFDEAAVAIASGKRHAGARRRRERSG
jgi:acyl-CoA synthetase (NDP forming)